MSEDHPEGVVSLDDRSKQNPEGTIGGYHVWAGHISKRIAGPPRGGSGGYVHASISLVHEHECGAWRFGRRHGPCTCGATEAWERWAAAQGDGDPFAGIVSPDGRRPRYELRESASGRRYVWDNTTNFTSDGLENLPLSREDAEVMVAQMNAAQAVVIAACAGRQARDVRRADAARERAASEGDA